MSTHLDWHTFDDFTDGLWTAPDWMVPQKAATRMDDCYAEPSGGLRAGPKFGTFPTDGIPSTAYPLGFYIRSGIPLRDGSPTDDSDRYLMVYDTADNSPKLFRWDSTVSPEPTSWSLIKTFQATTAGQSLSQFVAYVISGTIHVYVSLWAGPDAGLWRIRYSDGAVTQITTHANIRALTTHQDRIVYGHAEAEGTRLVWNDPGTETFASDNFLEILPFYNQADNMWAKSYTEHLIVAKQGAPMALVQGNIDDATVRILQGAHVAGEIQGVAETPDGVAFIAWRDGIYLTFTGSEVEPISEQILASEIADNLRTNDGSLGQFAFTNDWLYLPSGHVWDYRTNAWFKTTAWGQGGVPGKFMQVDEAPDHKTLFVVPSEQGFSVFTAPTTPGRFDRMDTYSWRSAPMRHPSGRRLVVREVQVVLKPFTSGASCTVTVNGQPRTVTNIPAGSQKVSFIFHETSEVQNVLVQPNSGNTSVEAPAIIAVRVGTLAGRLTF